MTSVFTKKWIRDEKDQWVRVPVILTRSGDGWIEEYPEPSDRADRKEAA